MTNPPASAARPLREHAGSQLRAESREVYYSTAGMVVASAGDLDELKKIAEANPRLRSRLCAHPSPSAGLHEMLIVHHRDVYVRPHMHIGKPESFHIIEGTALAVVLEEDGAIRDVLDMGPWSSGRPFYYRMPERVFHTLIITSEWLVFHETTAGPFDPAHTRFPDARARASSSTRSPIRCLGACRRAPAASPRNAR